MSQRQPQCRRATLSGEEPTAKAPELGWLGIARRTFRTSHCWTRRSTNRGAQISRVPPRLFAMKKKRYGRLSSRAARRRRDAGDKPVETARWFSVRMAASPRDWTRHACANATCTSSRVRPAAVASPAYCSGDQGRIYFDSQRALRADERRGGHDRPEGRRLSESLLPCCMLLPRSARINRPKRTEPVTNGNGLTLDNIPGRPKRSWNVVRLVGKHKHRGFVRLHFREALGLCYPRRGQRCACARQAESSRLLQSGPHLTLRQSGGVDKVLHWKGAVPETFQQGCHAAGDRDSTFGCQPMPTDCERDLTWSELIRASAKAGDRSGGTRREGNRGVPSGCRVP